MNKLIVAIPMKVLDALATDHERVAVINRPSQIAGRNTTREWLGEDSHWHQPCRLLSFEFESKQETRAVADAIQGEMLNTGYVAEVTMQLERDTVKAA
jgi:hypothetical protein